jgi:hypothetical protein
LEKKENPCREQYETKKFSDFKKVSASKEIKNKTD